MVRCFGNILEEEKNIDVDVFDDVLQNTKHRANNASNDVNRPPLLGIWAIGDTRVYTRMQHKANILRTKSRVIRFV